MKQIKFLTIFTTFGKLDIVKKTLPSVLEETNRNNAALLVFDSTDTDEKEEKWKYLQKTLDNQEQAFLVLSDNTSLALARNTCLFMGQKMFMPSYICMIDDDHGFKSGIIPELTQAMDEYYGVKSPNGLKYGLFSGCNVHRNGDRIEVGKHLVAGPNCPPGTLGGTNGCFRCAPTHHWNNVLNGYSVDEYVISYYQSRSISNNNYNRGFTTLIVNSGNSCFFVENKGRGDSTSSELFWDDKYTASDTRAKFRRK